jgi:hypothetical protein
LLVCSLGCAACGDGNTEKDKQVAAVERFYEAIAIEYCNYAFRCCEDAEIGAFKALFLSRAGCDTYYQALLKTESYLYRLAVNQGSVRVDENALAACIDAMRALACAGVKSSPYPPSTPPIIVQPEQCQTQKLFSGVRQAGEACESALDCAKGTRCYTSSSMFAKGVCVPLRAKGEPCTSSKDCDSSAATLVCAQPKNSPASCQPPAKEGEPCLELPCDSADPNLFCDSSKDPKNPVCARRYAKKEGESCKTTTECEKGLFCDIYGYPSSLSCRRYKKPGEACKSATECESSRCDYPASTCGSLLCDGKGNGPPLQLDSPPKPDYGPFRDLYPPKPDRGPDKKPPPDKFVWPDIKKVPDKPLWPDAGVKDALHSS